MNRLNPEQTAAWLRERDDFLVLTHIRPDGDTLGCGAGLCAALRKIGKHAAMLYNPGTTGTYAPFIPGYWAEPGESFRHIVAVDIATENLFFPEEECFRGRVELCIDHHESNEFYAENVCLNGEKAACGEIILEIVHHLCPLDDEIATTLYMAVSTDTGCFVYANTTPETMVAAAELMAHSERYRQVNKHCFRTKSFNRLRLEARVTEELELYRDGLVVVVSVPVKMLEEMHATVQDAEDLSAFGGQVEGAKVSVTLREQDGGVRTKISVRTDAAVLSSSAVCALLGGGGHAGAAGATVELPLPEAKQAVLAAIDQVWEG